MLTPIVTEITRTPEPAGHDSSIEATRVARVADERSRPANAVVIQFPQRVAVDRRAAAVPHAA